MEFNPFGEKDIKSIKEQDLPALYEVDEGWYIEYKRELSNASAIAKSVSAFANTYGGWLFYGVEEKSREEQVAGGFPGIPVEQVAVAISRIRQAVASRLNPEVHYETHVIKSSGAGILPENSVVIAVRVRKSHNTPHVHNSGLIYRRVGDGSEPVPEVDRSRLGQLFDRRKRLERFYKRVFEKCITIPEDQKNNPFLRVMVVTDLWTDRNAWFSGDIERVREIMGSRDWPVASWPFDTVHPSMDGFLARQMDGNRPDLISSTWELSRNLVSDIAIPLNNLNSNSVDEARKFLSGYDHAENFISILQKDGHEHFRILDLNCLFATIVGLSNIQMGLMSEVGVSGQFWFKVQVRNLQGFSPFLDCRGILDIFDKHRVPVVLRKLIEIFPGSGLNSFIESWDEDENVFEYEDTFPPSMHAALRIFTNIVRALGVPEWIFGGNEEDVAADYFLQLTQAGERFMRAQSARNLTGP